MKTREITEIILHCSATPEGRHVTASDIDRWHRQRGFNSIGYHYVVYLDGQIVAGHPEHQAGAHCKGHNSSSIGICYIGGCDKSMKPKDTRTIAQLETLKTLVSELQARYPGATVHGHYEFAEKACPSFNVGKEFGS